jgi:hypothetical protein
MFFKLFGQIFLGFGAKNFRAGSSVSLRAGCEKPGRSERILSQSDCLILTDNK